MHDFLNVEYITTFSGTVLAVALIVQFTKSIVKRMFSDRAVRVYAFVWALIFVVAANIYQGSYAVRAAELPLKVLLTIVNAIIVTLAAIGGYEVVTDPNAEKQKPVSPGAAAGRKYGK